MDKFSYFSGPYEAKAIKKMAIITKNIQKRKKTVFRHFFCS